MKGSDFLFSPEQEDREKASRLMGVEMVQLMMQAGIDNNKSMPFTKQGECNETEPEKPDR